MEIAPIFDMYAMLDHYLPGGLVDQDEMDQKKRFETVVAQARRI